MVKVSTLSNGLPTYEYVFLPHHGGCQGPLPAALPDGRQEVMDDNNQIYYWNVLTNETQWASVLDISQGT